MADPVVSITNGIPTSGTGTITTLGQTLVDGANATIGITTGAAVTTSAAGTLQQYLRGIVSLLVSGITVASHAVTNAGTFAVQVSSTVSTAVTNAGTFAVQATISAGAAIIGKVGIDQTTDGTTNKVRAILHDGTTAALVKAASSGAAATSDPAIVVTLRDVNANGSAVSASSAPVVIASDQAAVTIKGAAASGASASGNPVPMSGLAVSSETVVTAGQAAALLTDLARKLIVLPYANPENFVSGAITTAMTGTTTTSLIAAPAAGLRNYITQITVSNAHATVGTDIIIQDGSGGTTLYTVPAAAVYGGAVITFPTPLRQPTTATAIFCANVTTGASTKVSASGYKGA